jgi:phage pi2 protein 07
MGMRKEGETLRSAPVCLSITDTCCVLQELKLEVWACRSGLREATVTMRQTIGSVQERQTQAESSTARWLLQRMHDRSMLCSHSGVIAHAPHENVNSWRACFHLFMNIFADEHYHKHVVI